MEPRKALLSPQGQQCQRQQDHAGDREPGVPLPPPAGDQGMGVQRLPARWGSPKDITALSAPVLLTRGSTLPGLPAPLPGRTAARYHSSLQGAETGTGCLLHGQAFPRTPAMPR